MLKKIFVKCYSTVLFRDIDLIVHTQNFTAKFLSPLPEHCNWGTIFNIESIQRLAPKSVCGFNDLSYNYRLNELQLTTLLEQRMHGDLIDTFNIVNGFTDYGRDWFTFSFSLLALTM